MQAALLLSPASPLPTRRRPWSRGPLTLRLLSWLSCGRAGAAALCRHLFLSPWPPRRRAAAWPAEGPVGPEMWHRQGGERLTGRGALQVYPVLKENKIFSWETFPLCFSSPLPLSFCSFLLGCLPGSAPCLLPWSSHPAALSWLPVGLALLGPRLCGGWHAPVRHLCSLHLAFTGRGRVRGWPTGRRSTGESQQPVSQLCLLAVQAQPQVCSPGSRHTRGLSACAGILCCCHPTLPQGGSDPGEAGVLVPSCAPRTPASVFALPALCTSGDAFERSVSVF